MKNKEIYSILYDCCRWNLFENVKDTLEKAKEEVDLTYDDGQLFRIAIAHGFTDIFKTLLKYYEENKLKIKSNKFQESGYNAEYANYLNAKNKLQDIFEDAYNSVSSLSPEIEKIINKYGIPRSDSDSDIEEATPKDFETTETSESNDISSSFEDLNLIGEEH